MLTHLSEGGDPVLVGEQRGVLADLEVKVDRLVSEGGELVAEAELVGSVLGRSVRETVVLFLHLLVENRALWVFQATVHIVMSTRHNLTDTQI